MRLVEEQYSALNNYNSARQAHNSQNYSMGGARELNFKNLIMSN